MHVSSFHGPVQRRHKKNVSSVHLGPTLNNQVKGQGRTTGQPYSEQSRIKGHDRIGVYISPKNYILPIRPFPKLYFFPQVGTVQIGGI